MKIGESWNESQEYVDDLTQRPMRRLTREGLINMTPTYHTGSAFSTDGKHLIFASVRDGHTWILRGDTENGNLTAIFESPGIGDRNYMHRGMSLTGENLNGKGICGNRVTLAPKSGIAVFTCERRLISVDMHTFDQKLLIEDIGEGWIFGAPCISPDESHVAICLSSAHPQMVRGEEVTREYMDYPDHKLRIVRVNLTQPQGMEILHEHAPAQSAHCAFCPVDPNLLYFDLDLPPRYWGGGNGKDPRIMLLNIAEKRAYPLKERYIGAFQIHSAWLWDGSAIAYHGRSPSGGVYIGITSTSGETIWEQDFPEAKFYGHLTPDVNRKAIILDGDFTENLLQWLDYETGKLTPICEHNTDWNTLPGQYPHPHPISDPTGKWLSFNSAKDGRSDVYLADLS